MNDTVSFTDPDDVHATCTAAADLIERDGLHRGTYWGYASTRIGQDYEPGMPLCTIGAIRVATGQYNGATYNGTNWASCAASAAVRDEIEARVGFGSIAAWNDDHKPSAETVISLLRDVAAKHQSDEYRSAPGGGG